VDQLTRLELFMSDAEMQASASHPPVSLTASAATSTQAHEEGPTAVSGPSAVSEVSSAINVDISPRAPSASAAPVSAAPTLLYHTAAPREVLPPAPSRLVQLMTPLLASGGAIALVWGRSGFLRAFSAMQKAGMALVLAAMAFRVSRGSTQSSSLAARLLEPVSWLSSGVTRAIPFGALLLGSLWRHGQSRNLDSYRHADISASVEATRAKAEQQVWLSVQDRMEELIQECTAERTQGLRLQEQINRMQNETEGLHAMWAKVETQHSQEKDTLRKARTASLQAQAAAQASLKELQAGMDAKLAAAAQHVTHLQAQVSESENEASAYRRSVERTQVTLRRLISRLVWSEQNKLFGRRRRQHGRTWIRPGIAEEPSDVVESVFEALRVHGIGLSGLSREILGGARL